MDPGIIMLDCGCVFSKKTYEASEQKHCWYCAEMKNSSKTHCTAMRRAVRGIFLNSSGTWQVNCLQRLAKLKSITPL